MQRITTEQAAVLADHIRNHSVDELTDDALETLEKLEWAINNANKLRHMFFGQVDRCAEDDVNHCYVSLMAQVGGFEDSPSKMLH